MYNRSAFACFVKACGLLFLYLAVEGGFFWGGAWWGCVLKGGEGEGAVSCCSCRGFLARFFFFNLWGGRRDLGGLGGVYGGMGVCLSHRSARIFWAAE